MRRRLVFTLLRVVLCALLAVVTDACASPAPPKAEPPIHYVPIVPFNVHYDGFDTSPSRSASASDVEEAKAKAENTSRKVLLHSFSATHFVFVVVRYEARRALANAFVVEQRLRVARSAEVTRQLGLDDLVHSYEVGDGTIRAGMSMEDVTRRLGPPASVVELGPYGSARWTYPTRTLVFLEGRLASFGPKDRS